MAAKITPAMAAYSGGVLDPRWSPSGTRLAWVQAVGARADVVVAPVTVQGTHAVIGLPQVVTADLPVTKPHVMSGGVLAWIGNDELVVCGKGGVLAVVPATGGAVRVLPIDGRASAPSVAPDNKTVAVACDTDDASFIAVLPLDGSRAPVRVSQADFAIDPQWAPDGRSLVWHAWDLPAMPFHDSRIERIAIAGDEIGPIEVLAGGGGIAVAQPRFSPDGRALGYLSDADGSLTVSVRDLASGVETALVAPGEHGTPTLGPGSRTFAWAPTSDAVAINTNVDGFGALWVAGLDGAAREVGRAWHLGVDWGAPGLVAVRSGAKTPRVLVHYSPIDDDRTIVAYGAPAGFDDLIEPDAVTWENDGVTVHGLWWQPRDGDGPAPVIVSLHGGPTDQARADWDARRAYFVAQGYAVFAVNARGSTGYGRAYVDALRGEWGVGDASDVATGIRAVVPARGGDPNRVAVMGGSAGGYLALRVCELYPDVVRVGISIYGVTDLEALDAETWRFESGYTAWLAGEQASANPSWPDRSPAHRASVIRTPVLLLQGDKDVVVPPAQHDALVDALSRAGTPVEHHVYEGEGHGWSSPDTVADELVRITQFLERWLGA